MAYRQGGEERRGWLRIITLTPSHNSFSPPSKTGSWNTSLFFRFSSSLSATLSTLALSQPLLSSPPWWYAIVSFLLVVYSLWRSTYWVVKHHVRDTSWSFPLTETALLSVNCNFTNFRCVEIRWRAIAERSVSVDAVVIAQCIFSHFGVFLISVKPLTTESTENKTTPKIVKLQYHWGLSTDCSEDFHLPAQVCIYLTQRSSKNWLWVKVYKPLVHDFFFMRMETSAMDYHEVVFKSHSLCTIFQLFGAAFIQGWLLSMFWVCKTGKSGPAHVKWKCNLT